MPEDASLPGDDPDRPKQPAPPADQSMHVHINVREVAPGGQVIGYVERLIQQPAPPPRLMLPARPPRFHGRQAELAELLAGLEPGRVFTICGPGGMGKTALAAEALHTLSDGRTPPAAFPDGIFFHSFYNQPAIDSAFQGLAAFFGEEPRPSPAAAAQRALAGRCALLVLDGAEAADDLSALLELRGRCAALITSRDRAQIYDRFLDLAPLPPESALVVLRDWAGEQAADEPAAAAVCKLLGRLPLALRLAGGYMASRRQPVSDYAAWLEPALQQGKRRQESVRVLFRRSLEYLDEDMREILGVASLLAFAPFDRPLLSAALGYDDARLLLALGELMRFSFLQPAGGGYQLVHVLLHSYGRQEVAAPPEALENLAGHFTRLAEEQSKRGPDGYAALDAVLPHILAVLSALHSAAAWQPLIDLATVIDGYLDLHGRWGERVQVCHLALEASRSSSNLSMECFWLTNLGLTNLSLRQVSEAIKNHEQALEIARKTGSRRNEAACLGNLGMAYDDLGEPRTAIDYFQKALEIAREVGDQIIEEHQLINLGSAHNIISEPRIAIDHFQKALEIAHQIGDRRGEGFALTNLGAISGSLHKPSKQIEYYEKALEIARQSGDRYMEGGILGNLGIAYREQGELSKAIDLYQQALEIARQIGDRHSEAANLSSLGIAYQILGNPNKAIDFYQQALNIQKAIGDRRGEGNTLDSLGMLHFRLGEPGQAIQFHQQGLEIARQIGDRRGEIYALRNLGNSYAGLNQPHQAIECYQQALEIARQIGSRHYEGQVLGNLGNAFYAVNKPGSAVYHLKQALEISHQIGDRNIEANALIGLGTIWADIDDPDQARLCYQQAILILESILPPNDPNLLIARHNLSTLPLSS